MLDVHRKRFFSARIGVKKSADEEERFSSINDGDLSTSFDTIQRKEIFEIDESNIKINVSSTQGMVHN